MAVLGPTTDHAEIRRWAEKRQSVPVERLPSVLDHEPALVSIMLAEQAGDHPYLRVMTWEEFFLKFDSLGLTFVYDDSSIGYNEILQIEGRSAYWPLAYKPVGEAN